MARPPGAGAPGGVDGPTVGPDEALVGALAHGPGSVDSVGWHTGRVMSTGYAAAMRILSRDPLHKVPGCWYVQDSKMLKDLDERTVESMARRSTLASFEEGELLHQAGEPMDAVSFLSECRAKVYRVSADGKQQTIVLLGPGDAFGEIGIVDPSSQDLYVEAMEHVVVCRTTREVFLQMASRDPELAVRLAEAMGEKLQTAREQVADFAFRDIRGRVASDSIGAGGSQRTAPCQQIP